MTVTHGGSDVGFAQQKSLNKDTGLTERHVVKTESLCIPVFSVTRDAWRVLPAH